MTEPLSERTPKKSPLLLAAVAVAVALFSTALTTGGISAALAFIFCGGATAWLIVCHGWLAGLATAIPSYILGWLFCGSPLFAALSLLFYPSGILFALVYKKRLTRTLSVLFSSLFLFAVTAGSLACVVYLSSGSFTLSGLRSAFPEFFASLENAIRESFRITVAGKDHPAISDQNLSSYVTLFIGLFPGLLAAATVFLSFLVGWAFRLLLSLTGRPLPPYRVWALPHSPVAAAFFLSSLLVMAASPDAGILWEIAVNLLLLLFPGFFFAGLASLSEIRIVGGVPRPRILRPCLFFFSMFTGLIGPLLLASFFGLLDSLKVVLPKRTPKAPTP